MNKKEIDDDELLKRPIPFGDHIATIKSTETLIGSRLVKIYDSDLNENWMYPEYFLLNLEINGSMYCHVIQTLPDRFGYGELQLNELKLATGSIELQNQKIRVSVVSKRLLSGKKCLRLVIFKPYIDG